MKNRIEYKWLLIGGALFVALEFINLEWTSTPFFIAGLTIVVIADWRVVLQLYKDGKLSQVVRLPGLICALLACLYIPLSVIAAVVFVSTTMCDERLALTENM